MEENTNKVKEIFKWYHQFNNSEIRIKSNEKEFEINISDRALPHLLGLQYTLNSEEKIRGRKLYEHIRNKNMTDQDIYDLVSLNNEDKLNDVANRINTFKEFMENLDKGYILEQTNPHTQIKSNYLVVQSKDNLFLHLGIKESIGEEVIVDFKVDDKTRDILETYFARGDISYFSNSKIFEKIEVIERYDEKEKDYIPFSFDEEKNKVLLKTYYLEKENRKKELENLVKETTKKEIAKDNYNALTGNRIIVENHLSGEKRWLTASDVKEQNISIKENEKPILTITTIEKEGKFYAKPIELYNVSQLNITKEIEQKFVPMKEKIMEKTKDKGIER